VRNFGKEFLIVEPLVKLDWQLVNETKKKLGSIPAIKAEVVVPVTEKQKK
jgi:hypothetical protein